MNRGDDATPPGSAGSLDEVRAAVQSREWREAVRMLDSLATEARSPAGLELRAQAAYGNGDFEAAVTAWEDLHAVLAEEDPIGAARAATMAAMYLMMDTGLMAPVRGWLRRAERLLKGHDETPAHALIAMTRTYERFMCGDMEAARTEAATAIELGQRLGVQPAVVIGRVAAARIEIQTGQVDEGLAQLDEIGALLMSGEVDPLTTGMMYCELICAAQGLSRFDLASEWTDVMEHWRHGVAVGGINGRCRVHRAEMLRISGPCDAAETEALAACDELRPWMRREFGWPLVELGNIRLRKGDLAGAEEAFVAAHQHAWTPHPGLALVRLAQGEVDDAAALIANAIAHPFDIPSKERPPFGDLRSAPLLEAQAEIAAGRGDTETARRAASALRAVADAYESRGLDASASLAVARVALLDDNPELAIDEASRAVVRWVEMGAPYDAAAGRVVLGEAHRRAGDAVLARLEWEAALDAFRAFGADGRAAQVQELLAGDQPGPSTATPSRPGGSAPTEGATFVCEGDTRRICFGGETILVRDLKGLRHLSRLLAEPGREFHVLDLVAAEEGALPVAGPAVGASLQCEGGGGLPVIDDQAREAYRRRLAEVEEDIDDATRMNDLGRLELAERDRDYLMHELRQAAGLGNRHRSVGSTAERARTSVTRSLRYAIKRLDEHHPMLATHLAQTVHTGTYCSYTPDPLAPVTWQVQAAPQG